MDLEKILGTDTGKEAFYKSDRNFGKIKTELEGIDVAVDINYDNAESELESTDVQSAIDELKELNNDLRTDVGDKSTLTTTDKTNLVNAINEHEAQINSLDDEVVNHKTENASQDNVHGLREEQLALGHDASASGARALALGDSASAENHSSTALGRETTAVSPYGLALGAGAVSENPNEGVLGTDTSLNRTRYWKVPGDFTVSGTKNFEISHPNPVKKATHVIRHGCVESPTAGDTLYRYEIEAIVDGETVELILPDYFKYLNKNVDVWVNGVKHFGKAYADVEDNILKVTCEIAGKYRCLILGTRNDDAVQDWIIKGVEREIGESWTGETYVFSVNEIIEVEEIKEEEF